MSIELKIVIFIVTSLGITWMSRSSLNNIRSHGFYRFFAFETILILILMNINYWFFEPFKLYQIVSWLLLTISLYFVLSGVLLLSTKGKPSSKRREESLLGIEKTTELVTIGVYRFIRHPLYSSLLFLCWGAFFKHLSWLGIFFAVITTFFLTMTAKIEEVENIKYFGASYQRYMEETKKFIPFLF